MARYRRLPTSETLQTFDTTLPTSGCSNELEQVRSVQLIDRAEFEEQRTVQQLSVQLHDLPAGLISGILDFLPPDSLLEAACVCRDWQHVVHTDKSKHTRVAWYCKAFVQPGLVAAFRTKPRLISRTSERRLLDFRERIGKLMLLQA